MRASIGRSRRRRCWPAIAERGADAVGYAYRAPAEAGRPSYKQRTGASRLLERIAVPRDATEVLVHVRDYTKGHPSIAANNHPVRHGPVVGIHNGIIVNDDEILGRARLRARRAADDRRLRGDLRARRHSRDEPARARGAARLDGDRLARRAACRTRSSLARGVGRPLWIGTRPRGAFFASTRARSRSSSATSRIRLRKREIARARSSRSPTGEVVAARALPPRPLLRRGATAPGRPRPARGRLLPRSASPRSPRGA